MSVRVNVAAGLPPQWSGYVSPSGAIVAWTRRS